ncbi:MAG: hypothetical protein AVDCRST_MAG91-704 [uncultured Sphingomonadaceae bacterium]|uniref:PhiE125 gp8 family phage protein n=1 Tax=uncultured Sphingomonadaceae bacterium TaxID=169976 RepID=A0A6J4SAG3_9SPHN|nr:MAG: hypothetical protein AVDCRST_MAG91-704 [uncultured Sphingomonadaceae bacterium]
MLTGAPIVLLPSAISEAKAFARIHGSDEDALVAGLMASAAELCEQFTLQALVARSFTEVVPATGNWTRLGIAPVRAITGVEMLHGEGRASALAVADYAVDIDPNGDGWVRVTRPMDAARLRVTFEAGLAANWESVPDALRHGVVRLATHLFMQREEAASRPPAAVTALWRPWRRMRIA